MRRAARRGKRSMHMLYHVWMSPFSRKVRVAMREKGIEFDLIVERDWERRHEFLALNPAGTVPVLVEPDGRVLSDSQAICEYVDEAYPGDTLIGETTYDRAEVRRLVAWFDDKFFHEVTHNLVGEKLYKRFQGGEPDSSVIRAGHRNIASHLEYIAWLAERRQWLAGALFSLADIAAAAQLSCVDYLADVPWKEHAGAKDWYARVKSRPSYRQILADRIPGVPPAGHYADLDF